MTAVGEFVWRNGMSTKVVSKVRVGMSMKWAPMLGYDVPDHTTGVYLLLLEDGSVAWEPRDGAS